MSLTVTFIDAATVKKFAEDALKSAGLPAVREIEVAEDLSFDGDNVFALWLGVNEGDDLGTAQQRMNAAGLIQRQIWQAGDPRTLLFRHRLVQSNPSGA